MNKDYKSKSDSHPVLINMSNFPLNKVSPEVKEVVHDKRISRYMRCLRKYRSVDDELFIEKNDLSLQPLVVLNPIPTDSNIPVFERCQETGEKNGSVQTTADGMSDGP